MGTESKGRRGRPPVEGLAERRTEEILAAATQVFAEKGLRATDVEEIAERVGVGKGTVYRYFESKDELFLGTVRRVMDHLSDRVRAAITSEGDPVERLRVLMEGFLAFFEENPAFVEVLVLERAEFRQRGRLTFFETKEALREEFKFLEEDLEAAGVLRYPMGTPEGDLVGELMYGLLFSLRFSGSEMPLPRRRQVMLDLLLNGLLR